MALYKPAARTSAALAAQLSDETGSGAAVFATSPTLVTPALGTPASGNLANCTGYPGSGGITAIASGSIAAAATQVVATGIPETYAYLVLEVVGASSNTASRQMLVQFSTNNGSSYDSTAGNYPGHVLSTTTVATKTLASMVESLNVTAAQTSSVTITIENYHTGPNARVHARMVANSVEHNCFTTLLTGGANIDAIQLLWNGSGNFDAGTYALYGVS